jgi:hypothetical protein
MNLEITPTAAILASPGIALKDLQPKLLICVRVELDARLLRATAHQEALSLACSINALRWGWGRNLKPRDRLQQHVGIRILEVRSCHEVRTDHFQAVPTRLVRSEH